MKWTLFTKCGKTLRYSPILCAHCTRNEALIPFYLQFEWFFIIYLLYYNWNPYRLCAMLLQSSSGLRILRANIYYGEAGVISMKLEALSLSHTQLLDFNEINGAGCQTIQMRVFGFKLNPHYEVMGVLVKRPLLFAPIRTISYHLSQNQFFIICVLSMVSVDTVFNVIFWGCFWFPPTHGFPMETVNEARSTWFHCQFSVYEHGITPL